MARADATRQLVTPKNIARFLDFGSMSRESPRKRSRDAENNAESDILSSPSVSSALSPPPLPPLSEEPATRPYDDLDELDHDDYDKIDEIDRLEEAAEEEDGEDLFGDAMTRDYDADAMQDRYDVEDAAIDDAGEYDALDLADRRAVDAMLDQRDRGRPQRGQQGAQFLEDDSSEDDDRRGALPSRRRVRERFQSEDDDGNLESDGEDPLNRPLSLDELRDVKASSVAEWVTQPVVSRTIAREFKNFLVEFTDSSGQSVYGARITSLGEINAESLIVDYAHLADSRAVLATFLIASPAEVLKIMDFVAMQAVELVYPVYRQIHAEIHVRIAGLPVALSLRDLREQHLNTLVRVSGVATRRTGVFPQLKYVKFDCRKCGQVLGPYVQDANQEVSISFCHNCQSRGPFTLNSEKTVYRNYQRITVQESPGSVPAGRLPRQRDVILLWDAIDSAKPGDDVEITGIYKNAYDGSLNARNGFPVFRTVLEANLVITKSGSDSTDRLSEAEEMEAKETVRRSQSIVDDIVASIAPSIFGHIHPKTAIAASLFGGVPQESDKTVTRGDINVLLLGDPGTAKSQLLKYAEKTARRAVFATGQGASAVGLTASVRRDAVTREWTLEGGALVLADKGTCLIDEFDKMNDADRTSIHEAMEQQTISISKAGIVASLQARCAVVAAANPYGGRYNASLTFAQNVDLTEPILSRFDVLCVVRDIVNPQRDEELARFVVSSHDTAHARSVMLLDSYTGTDNQESSTPHGPISQRILRNIIHVARTQVFPKLSNPNQLARITKLYQDLRAVSLATGAIPITVRHLESIVRLSQAFARMRLSQQVLPQDVTRAIQVIVETFVGAQKTQVQRQLRRQFAVYL